MKNSIALMLPRISLTQDEALKGFDLFLGRKPVSADELERAIEEFRTISGMNEAFTRSTEFKSWACRKRLKKRRVTPESVTTAFELVLRRAPEHQSTIDSKTNSLKSQYHLLKEVSGSNEAKKKANDFHFFSHASLNASAKTIYLHMPKTAGTSFNELARKVYSENAVLNRQGNIPYAGFIRGRIIGGHFHYHMYEQMTGQRIFLAVVRNPIERAISLFNFYQHRELTKAKRIRGGFDHDDIKETIMNSTYKAMFVDNPQCRYLSGAPEFSAVRRAFERDAFIAGHFQNLTAWLQRLGDRLGWTERKLPRQNVARHPDYMAKYIADSELVDILSNRNREDFALYEFIKQQGVYESHGATFDYEPFKVRDQHGSPHDA